MSMVSNQSIKNKNKKVGLCLGRVRLIWRQLGVLHSNQDFWRLELQDWLVYNGLWKPNGAAGSLPWKMVFPFALWNIWKSRNGYVFRGKILNPKLAEEIVNQGMEFLYCADSPRDLTCSIIKRVRWEKPQVVWKKLNTDGASKGNPGLAGCGGVVRDENGGWIAGFSRLIGVTSSFEAELWGLREGLIFCSNLNIHSLLVELDAKAVVDIFLRASALKNATLFYFTISKSYFINYTIPFYNTSYIQKLYYFTFSLKYYYF